VLAGVHTEAEAETLRQVGSTRLTPLLLDLTNPLSILAAVAITATHVGENWLMGLVHHAGLLLREPLEWTPLRAGQQCQVDVLGFLGVTRGFLPRLSHGQGRIVTVGFTASGIPLPCWGGYAAAKAALLALHTALRVELRPWKIALSMVEPEPMVSAALQGKASARLARQIPATARYSHAVMEAIREASQQEEWARIGLKYLRVVQFEIEKNTTFPMSRQHPGVRMESLLEKMSVTRAKRQGTKKDSSEDKDAAAFLKVFQTG
jgi:NAD(P)-dependent dehydrogenase (short-subunit alcohol dehydrogenase family)